MGGEAEHVVVLAARVTDRRRGFLDRALGPLSAPAAAEERDHADERGETGARRDEWQSSNAGLLLPL